jgi:hypothetical protein
MSAVRERMDRWRGGLQRTPLRLVPSPSSPSIAHAAVCGAIGGVVGASCMTVIRTTAQRMGLIEKTVPQVMEEWASERLDAEPPGGATGHHVADQLLHFGYGMVWGALYGAVAGTRRSTPLWVGGVFGIAQWAIGFFGFIPALQVHRPAHEATTAENLVNIGAHFVYGVTTALLTEELSRQTERGPQSDLLRHAARVG